MRSCELNAYGKINLGLDVTGRYPNGYHEVSMIMQSVSLHDTLRLTLCGSDELFSCTGEAFSNPYDSLHGTAEIQIITDTPGLSAGPDNLIYKAARLIADTYCPNLRVKIELDKRLPIAAGMAGGSSDAAATLKGLDSLLGLGLSTEELCSLGLKLGADVPFCIIGGTAHAGGIGEVLTPLPGMPECSILLVKPPVSVSTPVVYKQYDSLVSPVHPDIAGMKTALADASLSDICRLLGNTLEQVTCRVFPDIPGIKETVRELGADGVLMSGSGPTVFGIFASQKKAQAAYSRMAGLRPDCSVFLTTPENTKG